MCAVILKWWHGENFYFSGADKFSLSNCFVFWWRKHFWFGQNQKWFEWSSGFPHFLQFKPVFGNKEFMIWATVSSWSCFCWLYRASPSLAAKNIVNLILVLTIWWCPCVESSLVLLEKGVCYDQGILLGKLLAFAMFHSVLQAQICLLLQVFLDLLLLHSSPL